MPWSLAYWRDWDIPYAALWGLGWDRRYYLLDEVLTSNDERYKSKGISLDWQAVCCIAYADLKGWHSPHIRKKQSFFVWCSWCLHDMAVFCSGYIWTIVKPWPRRIRNCIRSRSKEQRKNKDALLGHEAHDSQSPVKKCSDSRSRRAKTVKKLSKKCRNNSFVRNDCTGCCYLCKKINIDSLLQPCKTRSCRMLKAGKRTLKSVAASASDEKKRIFQNLPTFIVFNKSIVEPHWTNMHQNETTCIPIITVRVDAGTNIIER